METNTNKNNLTNFFIKDSVSYAVKFSMKMKGGE